jgi:hypothetical protein
MSEDKTMLPNITKLVSTLGISLMTAGSIMMQDMQLQSVANDATYRRFKAFTKNDQDISAGNTQTPATSETSVNLNNISLFRGQSAQLTAGNNSVKTQFNTNNRTLSQPTETTPAAHSNVLTFKRPLVIG